MMENSILKEESEIKGLLFILVLFCPYDSFERVIEIIS